MSAAMDTVCYNENIANCYRSFLASAAKKQQRSSLDRKIHKLKKMLKPVMSLMRGRSEKTYYHKEAEPSPCCWADSSDMASDNAANEALEARLHDELVHGAGVKGAAIQVWIGGQVVEIPIVPGQPQVIPVHFVIDEDAVNGFCWTPLSADGDICCQNDDMPYITENQLPEMQVPQGPCAACAC